MAASGSNGGGYLATRSRIRVADLMEAKLRGEKWAMLTSYDALSAKIFDMANIPVLLVGDSAGQVVFGYKSTIPVTMDELIPLARAVASSCQRALVIADMPFGSYQLSPQEALRNATRFMKEAQVHGVKLEGGSELSEHVKLLTAAGIPVMGHVGLTPQSENTLSGYKIQARTQAAADALIVEVRSLQKAGVFACVVELVPSWVGGLLQRIDLPIIGIGAGPRTDAQVLVWTDMVGFTQPKGVSDTLGGYLAGVVNNEDQSRANIEMIPEVQKPPQVTKQLELARVPKFVKRYSNFSELLFEAAQRYADDVRAGRYPAEEHCYQ